MGDLLEERALGRSRGWYWRQIAVAVGRDLASGARRHPVLLVRAIATAALSYLLLAFLAAIGTSVMYVYFWFPGDGASRVNPASVWIVLPMILVCTIATGWIGSRVFTLSRRKIAPMTTVMRATMIGYQRP